MKILQENKENIERIKNIIKSKQNFEILKEFSNTSGDGIQLGLKGENGLIISILEYHDHPNEFQIILFRDHKLVKDIPEIDFNSGEIMPGGQIPTYESIDNILDKINNYFSKNILKNEGIKKIVIQENVQIGKILFEAGDEIYIEQNDEISLELTQNAAYQKSLNKQIAKIWKTTEENRYRQKIDYLNIIFKDGYKCRFFDEPDDSENRYMVIDDDLSEYEGAVFLGVEIKNTETRPTPNPNDVHEVTFLEINTDKGSFTIHFHNEQNGYYSGFRLKCEEMK